MSTSNNISLHINSGESLSFAIDKQLDKELGTNVDLNFNEWNSVFSIVKAEQVETNKSQFGENDTDIKSGKQFKVQAGEDYEIKQSTWQKIVDIAKQRFGGKTTAAAETQEAVQTEEADTTAAKSNEEIVSQILKDAGLEVDESDYLNILDKYENIVAYAKANSQEISDEKISERLVNYAKGLQYHNQETQFAQAWANGVDSDTKMTNDEIKEAMETGDAAKFKEAYHNAAKAYIEYMDNGDSKGNGKYDGKISVNEMLHSEYNDQKALGNTITKDEIKTFQQEVVTRFAMLDRNGDNTLDEDEISAYLWATSKINDGKTGKTADDITFSEWKTAQESMGIFSGTDLTDTQRQTVTQAFPIVEKTGVSLDTLYSADLSSLDLSADDKAVLEEALPLLEENGFTQDMIDKYGKFDQALTNGYNGLKN